MTKPKVDTKSKALKLAAAMEKERKAIDKRNAKFKAMPRMKQRVAIAKEVLSLIDGKYVVPTRGEYITKALPAKLAARINEIQESADPSHDWQQFLPQLKRCEVCNIGIATFASIKLRDGARVEDTGSANGTSVVTFEREDCTYVLEDLFDSEELDEMEHFFEYNSDSMTAKQSARFFWAHILKNRGEFDVPNLMAEYEKATDE